MSLPRLAPALVSATVADLRITCVLVALISLAAASFTAAQSPTVEPSAEQEPITPVPPAPAEDPRRVALGERLFADLRLSHDNTLSCMSCHDLRTNGANARDAAPDGKPGVLNTPTVFNASLNFRLNWEGNCRTLEAQAASTMSSPTTMSSSVEEAVGKLRADAEMVKQFQEAYGRRPVPNDLVDALATFERTLTTPGGRFDRWLQGDEGALTAEELSGYRLFKSLGCVSCHQGVNVGGNLLQRHGIFHPLGSPEPELVRVPSLRNVATTPPYFHDGSTATLPQAVRVMAFAQLDRVLTDEQTSVPP
jgi:cytochrome c peroxidase